MSDFSIIFILKGIMTFEVKESMHVEQKKNETESKMENLWIINILGFKLETNPSEAKPTKKLF